LHLAPQDGLALTGLRTTLLDYKARLFASFYVTSKSLIF